MTRRKTMKKQFAVVAVTALLIGLAACGGRPSDVLMDLQNAYRSGSLEDPAPYYTKGTVEAMKELGALAPKSGQDKKAQEKEFAKGARWEVVQEKVEGDAAEVKIKYVEHPVENLKGEEMTFRLRKEEGRWKIDMEKELRASIALMKQMGGTMGMVEHLRGLMK
jgi:hypothetical protein